ncbi:glycosyltransferase [Simiduia sp. 21SJ11W-1]|uniref:glycosyltransferase n=1 Tax=Simiduia sp. 21SJ11W-1 TaxID=2909669 RepID=UPI00209CA2DE|nr:glycosyltransferase [Simiduia sp. 21SJ11W-1]UTA49549.1 glycosyltransferase [Simiduia sp. 21SJ11W-1]
MSEKIRNARPISTEKSLSVPFSLLMAVYHADNASWLAASLSSICEQTQKPTEVILVRDGPIPTHLDEVITRFCGLLPIKQVQLPVNGGLAVALQSGLQACQYDWVARMDSDDIALPERFERQLAFLSNHPEVDVLGTWVSEFEENPSVVSGYRCPPGDTIELHEFAKRRCPLNHMTVIYRKKAVLAVGGYQGFRGIEDYFLWAKLINAGYRLANLTQVLVWVRGGESVARRRGGLRYLTMEAKLYVKFYRIGFLNLPMALWQFLIRLPVRLFSWLRVLTYRYIRKRS